MDCQAPLSMGRSRQEYWSGLLCPPPGDPPNPGIEPRCPSTASGFFPTEPPGKPQTHICVYKYTSLHFLCAAAAAKSRKSCPTLCNPIDGSPPGFPIPGILQARTRVGFHFLLQCMKVKSESEVAQSCLTLRDPMDCSLPGSSVHGIFQARVLEWGAIAFSALSL